MATVNKTLRINESIIPLIEEYIRVSKKVFGTDLTVNGVLASAAELGILQMIDRSFTILTAQGIKVKNPKTGEFEPYTVPPEVKSLLEHKDDYECNLFYEAIDCDTEGKL